jgi:opacity protein-like surface antigen
MKKYLLIVGFISAAVFTANAQEFKPVKIGLGLGYASPGGEGAKGGVLVYFEPAYRVSDAIAVGLRIESAIMARGITVTGTGATATSEGEVSGNASYSINGQYYFSNNESFRPFAGLGLGMYTLASASFSAGGSTVEASASESEFGFYPRIGFDAGHFTLQAEYNIIPDTESIVVSGGNAFTSKSKNSYLGIKAGFFISGGKR